MEVNSHLSRLKSPIDISPEPAYVGVWELPKDSVQDCFQNSVFTELAVGNPVPNPEHVRRRAPNEVTELKFTIQYKWIRLSVINKELFRRYQGDYQA
jgi:hypothetical protein